MKYMTRLHHDKLCFNFSTVGLICLPSFFWQKILLCKWITSKSDSIFSNILYKTIFCCTFLFSYPYTVWSARHYHDSAHRICKKNVFVSGKNISEQLRLCYTWKCVFFFFKLVGQLNCSTAGVFSEIPQSSGCALNYMVPWAKPHIKFACNRSRFFKIGVHRYTTQENPILHIWGCPAETVVPTEPKPIPQPRVVYMWLVLRFHSNRISGSVAIPSRK